MSLRSEITSLIKNIDPFDPLEQEQIESALAWLSSNEEIFKRYGEAALPAKHLTAYFVLIDSKEKKLLLVDHKKAKLWVPTGGHVEPGEHPYNTVIREMKEELGASPLFISKEPLFLSSVKTREEPIHIDVSLWYILEGNSTQNFPPNPSEFDQIEWFSFDSIPYALSDQHMERFMKKLAREISMSKK